MFTQRSTSTWCRWSFSAYGHLDDGICAVAAAAATSIESSAAPACSKCSTYCSQETRTLQRHDSSACRCDDKVWPCKPASSHEVNSIDMPQTSLSSVLNQVTQSCIQCACLDSRSGGQPAARAKTHIRNSTAPCSPQTAGGPEPHFCFRPTAMRGGHGIVVDGV